jgi:calcium-dependent protein kinase
MGNISYFKNCCPQDQEESRLEDGETAKEMTASFAKMYNENVLPKSESNSREKNLMESLYFLKDSVLIGKGSGNPVDKYKIEELIGKGEFSLVYRATLKSNGESRAFKVIKKDEKNFKQSQELIQEIKLLEETDNPYIVKMYEFYDCPRAICLINEYLKGGSIYDKLKKEKKFSEFNTAIIIFQVLSALSFCHSHKIIHRNLNLTNILIDIKDPHFTHIKIIDFSTSAKMVKGSEMEESKSNIKFTAPEVLKGKYNETRDIWSVGVIMYILLTGIYPFDGKDILKIKAEIELCNVNYNNENLKKCSNECIDLLKELLNKDKNRISAQNAIKHIWFKNLNVKERLTFLPFEKIKKVLEQIMKFKPKKTLQKLCLAYLVRNFNDESVNDASNLYLQIDYNNDGSIDENEFVMHLKEIIEKTGEKIDESYLKKVFENIDIDKSGTVEYSEFVAAGVKKELILKEENLKESFDFFDKNKNGLINLEDLRVVFMKFKGFSQDEFNSIVSDVDADENNEIDFEEYKNVMNNIME